MKEIVIKIPDKMYRMIMVSGKADIGWIARDFTHRLIKSVKTGTVLNDFTYGKIIKKVVPDLQVLESNPKSTLVSLSRHPHDNVEIPSWWWNKKLGEKE